MSPAQSSMFEQRKQTAGEISDSKPNSHVPSNLRRDKTLLWGTPSPGQNVGKRPQRPIGVPIRMT
jgi:hypothetical protein